MRANAETLMCASIAYPNRATKSPLMHNAAFEALGLNFIYLAFEPTDLEGATRGMRALGIRGFSVSKPHKEAIMPWLDKLDDVAAAIGAVNTVLNDNGTLIGYNSDWIGAVGALSEITSLPGKRAVLVGAGGAARAIAFGLKRSGVGVSIYNRTPERARKLAEGIGVHFGGSLESLGAEDHFDILINATSVGFYPQVEDCIIPEQLLRKGIVLMDVVFNPVETALTKKASAAGCQVIQGIRMLVLQGAFQFQLFTGQAPPLDVMHASLESAITGSS